MKEAYGGIFNLIFIIVFLTMVIGILGFVFSYTKAFKFKNVILDTIERYEASGCYPELGGGSTNSVCRQRIWEVAAGDLAYKPPRHLSCPSGYTEAYGLGESKPFYCYKMMKHVRSGNTYLVFRVIVQVDIEFPIIDRIAGMNIFQVTGDTEEILVR